MSAFAVRLRAREQLADRIAEPLRIADEIAADLVRHAREGGHALLEGQCEQLVPRDHDLVLDESVDAQTPVGRVDLRDDEGGVDPVEVLVRGEHGIEAEDAELGVGGDRRRGDSGRRQLDRLANGRHRLRSGAHEGSADHGEDADGRGAAGPYRGTCVAAGRLRQPDSGMPQPRRSRHPLSSGRARGGASSAATALPRRRCRRRWTGSSRAARGRRGSSRRRSRRRRTRASRRVPTAASAARADPRPRRRARGRSRCRPGARACRSSRRGRSRHPSPTAARGR